MINYFSNTTNRNHYKRHNIVKPNELLLNFDLNSLYFYFYNLKLSIEVSFNTYYMLKISLKINFFNSHGDAINFNN